MAKTSMIEKQKQREILVERQWAKRQELKAVVKSLTADMAAKTEAMCKLNQLKKNGSPVRLRNRCHLTGRPRGYLRKFGVSRIAFREMASHGLIPGVFKASW